MLRLKEINFLARIAGVITIVAFAETMVSDNFEWMIYESDFCSAIGSLQVRAKNSGKVGIRITGTKFLCLFFA
jgi:hypothetical protein